VPRLASLWRQPIPRWALLACFLVGAPEVRSQTDEIQVYDAEITATGKFNLTWHNNYTPSGLEQPTFPGGVVPNHALNGVPEWAYGVTRWFEAGLYLPVYTLTGGGQLLFDSVKLRALFVVPDAHGRTIFYGLNFELSYNELHWNPTRWAGEIRPILGTHLGRFDLIINPILDTNFNGLGRVEFAPAARAAYRINDAYTVALEHYAEYGPIDHFYPRSQQSQTLYAVLDWGTSRNGIEFGVGRGLTPATSLWVIKLMLIRDF